MNFWNGFLKGPFENSVMFLKIKEINFKKKHMNQNTKQNKRKQNHQAEISITQKKIEVVRMEANLHYFPMASEK